MKATNTLRALRCTRLKKKQRGASFRGLFLRCAFAFAVPFAPLTAATLSLPDMVIELDPMETSLAANEVLRLFEDGETEAAFSALNALLQKDPSDYTAIVIQGYSLLGTDPQASLNAAAKVLVQQGPRKDALDLMGMAYATYRNHATSDAIDADIRAVEIENNEKLLKKYPDWGELLFRTASQRIALERLRPTEYDQLGIAVTELSHLIEVLERKGMSDLSRGQAEFQLARAYKHLEDSRPTRRQEKGAVPENYQRALTHFQTSMEIDPSRLDAVGEIVLIYKELEQTDLALGAVRDAFALFEDPLLQAKLYEMEGSLLLETGAKKEAIFAFESALERDDRRDGSWLILAHILADEGDTGAAIDLLNSAAVVRPNTLEIHQARAELLTLSAPKDAVNSWNELLSVPSSEAVTLGMRPSPERFRTALYMTAALQLAELYIGLNDRNNAVATLKTAREYGATDAQIAQLSQAIAALP